MAKVFYQLRHRQDDVLYTSWKNGDTFDYEMLCKVINNEVNVPQHWEVVIIHPTDVSASSFLHLSEFELKINLDK